ALAYNVNQITAYLSRHLSNWSYAASRVNVSPFAWIDGDVKNEGSFTAPRDPAYVAAQLQAFSRWCAGNAFAIYSYSRLGRFDYRRYASGMQAAAGGADTEGQPQLTVEGVQRSGTAVVVSGTATDDTSIGAVLWRTGAESGAAPMTWTVTAG